MIIVRRTVTRPISKTLIIIPQSTFELKIVYIINKFDNQSVSHVSMESKTLNNIIK